MSQGAFVYRAFISYSHADKAVAGWLHRALEAYRLPSKLVGETTALGKVPARLTPIFRDRDELPAAGDLSDELLRALHAAQFLIVIASPAAAASRWVDAEIRQFKQRHGEGRVLAVIAAGRPGGGVGEECFPPSLGRVVGADGVAADQVVEPIAVDLRAGGDGRRLAKLKLVAGLTGLPLDALVRREATRRQRRLIAAMAMFAVLSIVMTILAVKAVRGEAEAVHQRAEADGLIEFMLTDLRQKLEPVGRLEIFDVVGQRALAYYAGQDLAALDANALGRRARALHLVGEVRELRGDTEGALGSFTEAERTTAELLARDRDNAQRVFDHAQSAYWVGYIAWQRNDLGVAETQFSEYDRLAAQLVSIDPANAAWQDERKSALTNLGVLYRDGARYADAAGNFRKALEIAAVLAATAPDDREKRHSLAQAHAWLADALRDSSDLVGATTSRQKELAVYEAMLLSDSRDAKALEGKAVALNHIAKLHLLAGSVTPALEAARIADETIRALQQQDSANILWQEFGVTLGNGLTEALMMGAQWGQAHAINRRTLAQAESLVATAPTVATLRTGGLMTSRWMQIANSFALGDRQAAREQIKRFGGDFAAARHDPHGSTRTAWIMVHALDALDHADAHRDEALALVRRARELLPARPEPNERAVLRYLDRAIPAAPAPRDAPAPAIESGYDPGPILDPAKGT